jgi:diguanylate cyclase (GGDEF)-like protein
MPLCEPLAESIASPDAGGASAEHLNTLWRLSIRQDLDETGRVRAILEGACRLLGMDAAVLGDFGKYYTPRYVVGDLDGLLLEGLAQPMETALCSDVFRNGRLFHVEDLHAHPRLASHPFVTQRHVRVYSGIPVPTGTEARWVLAFLRQNVEPKVDAAHYEHMELVAGWLGNVLHQSEQQALLKRIALTDPLTGLPNRRAAEERLQKEFRQAGRSQVGYVLALADLDHFKSVNDRYGHAIGDEVLKEMARRFQSGLREGDWVARWGGEEFLFVLHGNTAEEAKVALERIVGLATSEPVPSAVGPIPVTLSAGVGSFVAEETDVYPLLESVDGALYQAKHLGRDRIVVAAPPRRHWNGKVLRQTVEGGRVRMATQLIVDLRTGEAVADESLARIETEAGEMLDAESFIDMAEGLGLMAEIDRQVIRSTMNRCINLLADGGSPAFSHFVNVSPQFMARRDLVEEMLHNAMSYCGSCGVEVGPVKPVILELTERQRVVSIQRLREDLQPFIDFGFRLALDDFGSGYSSYLYLANLPVSFIKIEGWLVANMRRDRKVAGIVASLASFARSEGLQTVAEHVENAETAQMLIDMGVDYAQGWHYGRPRLEPS